MMSSELLDAPPHLVASPKSNPFGSSPVPIPSIPISTIPSPPFHSVPSSDSTSFPNKEVSPTTTTSLNTTTSPLHTTTTTINNNENPTSSSSPLDKKLELLQRHGASDFFQDLSTLFGTSFKGSFQSTLKKEQAMLAVENTQIHLGQGNTGKQAPNWLILEEWELMKLLVHHRIVSASLDPKWQDICKSMAQIRHRRVYSIKVCTKSRIRIIRRFEECKRILEKELQQQLITYTEFGEAVDQFIKLSESVKEATNASTSTSTTTSSSNTTTTTTSPLSSPPSSNVSQSNTTTTTNSATTPPPSSTKQTKVHSAPTSTPSSKPTHATKRRRTHSPLVPQPPPNPPPHPVPSFPLPLSVMSMYPSPYLPPPPPPPPSSSSTNSTSSTPSSTSTLTPASTPVPSMGSSLASMSMLPTPFATSPYTSFFSNSNPTYNSNSNATSNATSNSTMTNPSTNTTSTTTTTTAAPSASTTPTYPLPPRYHPPAYPTTATSPYDFFASSFSRLEMVMMHFADTLTRALVVHQHQAPSNVSPSSSSSSAASSTTNTTATTTPTSPPPSNSSSMSSPSVVPPSTSLHPTSSVKPNENTNWIQTRLDMQDAKIHAISDKLESKLNTILDVIQKKK